MKLKLLTIGLLVVAAGAARAAYTPLAITSGSYNADVIVEHTIPALDNNTTATTDGGTNNNGNGWYEVGYNTNTPTSGLPAHGTTFTHATFGDHSYTMAPDYTQPNALLIDTGVRSGTLTFATPTLVSNLSFLVTSGNGGGQIGCTIHHQDGSTETNIFNAGDWFNGANPAFIAYGRLSVTAGTFDGQGSIQNPGNPRLYSRDVPVNNTTSPVTSVDFQYASGGANVHNQIYAISGTPPGGGNCTPITITGYNYDLIVESNAPVAGVIMTAGGVRATTQSMDSDTNSNNAWFERGYLHNMQAGSGLPPQGSTITNGAGDHVFTLASDYTTNDVLYLNPSNTTATATLVTPTALSGISILNATGNGPRNINVAVYHADTTIEHFVFSALDWFNNSSILLGTSGRVATDSGALNNLQFPYVTNQAPYLHITDIALSDTTSPVTQIVMTDTNATNSGRTAIFAISGSAAPTPPVFSLQPTGGTIGVGTNFSFTTLASAGPTTVTYQWQAGTNGVWVNLSDGGNITGSHTTNLVITAATVANSADYQVIATDVAGSVTSSTATLIVVSPLTAVTAPSDPVTGFPSYYPANESPNHAIDGLVGNDPGKYLNFGNNNGQPFLGPAGFVVTPSMGRSIVTGVRLYTANDTQGRDPIDFELYGSKDGGSTYTLIVSNVVNLPAGRNNAASAPINPYTNFMSQYLFNNTNGYTTYKWQATHVVSDSGNNSMQIGEVELLGVKDTNGTPGVAVPAFVRGFSNSTVTISASVSGNPTPTLQWARGTGGSYTPLVNNGKFSGVTTTNLQIANVTGADAMNYVLMANNSAGSVTSPAVPLSVLSSEIDVTVPGNSISEFGTAFPAGSPNVPSTAPVDCIDDTTTPYINVGSGPSANAGFPPFQGPVGIIVTPDFGPSCVSGLRFYTGPNTTADDPTDFILEGSNDGGNTFATITSGSLSLPDVRNTTGVALNPLTGAMQEVLFSNTQFYTTYRLTFTHVKDASNANSMQIGDVEFLGVAPRPTLTFNSSTPGQLIITSSSSTSGTLQSTTNLQGSGTVWTTLGTFTGSYSVNISTNDPPTYFRVTVP